MGTLYRATCPECSYEQQFYLGSGLNSMDLFRSIRGLDQAEQTKIKNMHENGEIFCFSVENKLTRCRHCDIFEQLKDKVIITITDQSQHHHNFGHQCNSCGDKLEIYEEQQVAEKTHAVICPKCGEGFLIFHKAGLWD